MKRSGPMVGLADLLMPADRVALVFYGDAARTDFALADATAANADTLVEDIAGIGGNGATNLSEGMVMAYRQAAGELDMEPEVRIAALSGGVGNIGATGPYSTLAPVD